jgi:peptidyl-prolyl cis-trans isomerase-like 4
LKLRTAAQQARLNETRALMLQMTGDLADASLAPPENVVFVCKLNPLTVAEELRMCFSQFGKVVSCDIVKDRKTGASLRYGFIEFETTDQAERAFLKADKMLIDDSRIHVDFCQSVAGAWQSHRSEIGRKRVRD